MIEIELGQKNANIESLDETLRIELGGVFTGLAMRKGTIALCMLDEATDKQIEIARVIAANHDPAALSNSQREKLVRKSKIDRVQRELDDIDLDSLDPLTLWLVLEVTRLSQRFPDDLS